TRGITSWVLKSVKVLGVDLAKESALEIAKRVENRESLKRPGLGLCRCTVEGAFALTQQRPPSSDRPILVFLHGTLSSTWGSFGELWSDERKGELAQIRSLYGEQVYGFEHPTLPTSPIENALNL